MVRLKTQKKPASFAKGLEANEILTQGFGSFKLFVVDGCWLATLCQWLLDVFKCDSPIGMKIGLQNQILATIDQPMRISFLALWDIVYLKILQRRIKWTKYIKPTSLSLFWPISKVPCQYTPHSYDTNVQSLLPSKYLFCLCIHAPWSKTDEPLEIRNV